MKWDTSVYDRRHGFVAEFGRALLELVPDDPALSVLDLGCGTGALTARLAANGRRVDRTRWGDDTACAVGRRLTPSARRL